MSIKGPGEANAYDASTLRIGIAHTRWNTPIVSALVAGARKSLLAAGVPDSQIVTQSVPGSYELPFAVQRMYAASTTSSSASLVGAAADLLGVSDAASGSASAAPVAASNGGQGPAGGKVLAGPGGPLDAIIAIGVLIKGSTMHFEYIAEATSHGLMRVQLDSGCPVVFGVLTCLTEEQAFERSGLGGAQKSGGGEERTGHNHGEDWGSAAVEMAVKRRGWGEGSFVE